MVEKFKDTKTGSSDCSPIFNEYSTSHESRFRAFFNYLGYKLEEHDDSGVTGFPPWLPILSVCGAMLIPSYQVLFAQNESLRFKLST